MAVIWHAFATREQFFPSLVYLSNSKLSVAILGNLGFALALSTYKLLTWAFLGRLRDSEVERINDKVSQAIIETLLAMTIFRQDFTIGFFAAFVVLSFVKIFHWMVQDRVDFIETTPNVTRTQHMRIVAFVFLLIGIDYLLLRHALSTTLTKGVSINLLFAFEYAIQISTAMITLAKYGLSVTDMALEGRWEGKGVAVFYLELALDLLHLITYSAFFAAVFSTYGIPIHLLRDLYWTFRNFQTRVRDFLRFRRVAANMERRFPDATPEDLERADHVCIVCREEMGPGSRAKKLDCSHTFHLHCLRSWLERQQNCPICRAPVLATRRETAQREQPQENGNAGGGGRGREGGAAGPGVEAGVGAGHGEGNRAPWDHAREEEAEAAFRAQRLQNFMAQHGGEGHARGPAGNGATGGEGRRQGQDGPPGGPGGAARFPHAERIQRIFLEQQQLLREHQELLLEQHQQLHPDMHPYMQYPFGAAQYPPQYLQQYPQTWFSGAPPMAMLVPNIALQQVQYAGQLGPEVAAGDGAGTASSSQQTAQQAQHMTHGVVPIIPVPILIPLMTPPQAPQPPGTNNNSSGGDGAGTSASGTSTSQQEQQPTPEQHAMASAIAAAATAAAMMAIPVMSTPLGGHPQPPPPPEQTVPATANAPVPSSSAHVAGEATTASPRYTSGENATPVGTTPGTAASQSQPSSDPLAPTAGGQGSNQQPELSPSSAAAAAPADQGGSGTDGRDGEADEIRRRRLERFQAGANL